MKKILILSCLLLSLLSCDDSFMDQVPDDRLTFEETFSKQSTAEQYLASIYAHFPNEFAQRYTTTDNSGPWTGASDEAEYVWDFHMGNSLNIGDWDPTMQEVSTLWSNFYRAIRSASTFISNIDQCKNCTSEIKKQYIAEARILRAFYYYNLMRTWGPIILMGDEPIPPDADFEELELERSSLDAITDYIVSELDKGAEALDGVAFTGDHAGRMRTPFAMAIKEKTLLFAASPLFNGNSDYADLKNEDGENLIPQTYDKDKWKRAADAAKAFIDKYVPNKFELYKEYDNGSYSPFLSVKNNVIKDYNDEIIYAEPRGGNNLQYEVTPLHLGIETSTYKGSGGLSVTQEMVDAFFTENGRSIEDPKSNYKDSGFSDFKAPDDVTERSTYNPWVNREPRFYAYVTYNGRLWLNRDDGDIITTTWYDGNSGRNAGGNDYPPTGYIVRKKAKKDNGDRSLPYMRLAEIYLDYAEALNEYDPGNPDILKYVNLIRERAGIPEYGDPNLNAPSGQDEVRKVIWRERRIELFVENVRYFDARRWKIADDVFAGSMHGKDINARDEDDFYETTVFEERIFRERDYLWPIPQDEVNTHQKLVQNPGW